MPNAGDAIAKYTQRVRAGVPADKLYENTRIEALPLLNVEAIDCRWVADHQTVIIVGATGTGKSFLACALAHQACRKGYRARY